jgi:TonB family protein
VLQAHISKTGDIEDLSVVSGHPMLAQAAKDAVKQWKYKPCFLNGEPVKADTTINVNFTLVDANGFVGSVFRVGNGVSPPHELYTPDPEYSEEARTAKYQGTVVLWLIVGPDGKPRDIRISRPLGKGLDQKAIEAVSRWLFEPAMKDGKPAAVMINVEVNFRLY